MKKKWEYEKEEDFEDLFIDDIAEEDENAEADQNTEEDAPQKRRGKVSLHYIFLGAAVCIVIFAAVRLAIWNKGIKDDTDVSISNPEYDIESMDYILPLNPQYLAVPGQCSFCR